LLLLQLRDNAAQLLPLLPPLLLPALLRCAASGNNSSCHTIQGWLLLLLLLLLLFLLLLLPVLCHISCSLLQLAHSKGKPATAVMHALQ
jgi:hypothetical protein